MLVQKMTLRAKKEYKICLIIISSKLSFIRTKYGCENYLFVGNTMVQYVRKLLTHIFLLCQQFWLSAVKRTPNELTEYSVPVLAS